MMDQRYLFITGCARSGTTALAKLVGSHNNIIMGIERFGCLVSPKNFTMTKDHFKFDRFFDVKPGDTFYNNFDDFHKWDSNIRNKIKTVKYIGDKRPDLYHVYDKLFAEFENAKVLFMM